jgi:hypothetical protein
MQRSGQPQSNLADPIPVHGKPHHGYKFAVRIDRKHKFSRARIPDTACVHNSYHQVPRDPSKSAATSEIDPGRSSTSPINATTRDLVGSLRGSGRAEGTVTLHLQCPSQPPPTLKPAVDLMDTLSTETPRGQTSTLPLVLDSLPK